MASNLSVRPGEKRATIPAQVYIGVAAALAVAIGLFFYLRQPPPSAPQLPLTPEAKAYVHNLKLADVDMKATDSYFNQQLVEISGKITNAGEQNLTSVEIYCIFYDSYNQLVLRRRIPIVSEKMGGLKPGETKSFRLPFDDLPDSWNHVMPQLVIAGIKFS